MRKLLLIGLIFILTKPIKSEAGIGPDGTGDVNGYQIGPGAFLSQARLQGADLSGANLSDANLRGADLVGVNFKGANLKGANLNSVKLQDSDLEGADISGADFTGANLIRSNFKGAELTGAKLISVDATLADFQSSEMTGAVMTKSNFDLASFVDANMSAVKLFLHGYQTSLKGADLTRAKLQFANFKETLLIGAKLINADLYGVNLINADLTDANLIGAKFSKNEFDGAILVGVRGFELEHNERVNSVLIEVDPEVRELTLKMIIEQSDNLTEWTKLDGELTRTIPIPDSKKFYRFALDK